MISYDISNHYIPINYIVLFRKHRSTAVYSHQDSWFSWGDASRKNQREAPLFILTKIAGFRGGTLQEKINGIWDIIYGFWMSFGAGKSWRKGDLLVKKCRMAIDIP
jgi:hypothetical protein